MEELKYKINPKFNFIYEITMPLGAKLRRSMFMSIIFIIAMIVIKISNVQISLESININLDIAVILYWTCLFFAIIFLIKFFIDMALKIMQYNRISYSFFDDKVIYEDTFLNQQRKVVKYENIKEIEIRRTIWDRIIGFGIIIISTNAEGKRNSGLVIYGISNPDEVYNEINKLVDNCNKKNIKNHDDSNFKNTDDKKINENTGDDDFKLSLKNIK